MKKYLFIFLLVFFSCAPSPYVTIEPQIAATWVEGNFKRYQPTFQTNPDLDFYNFIKGVSRVAMRHSIMDKDGNRVEDINKMPTYHKDFIFGLKRYLQNLGFKDIAITKYEKEFYAKSYSSCSYADFWVSWNFINNTLDNVKFNFSSCKGDIFTFSVPRRVGTNSNGRAQANMLITEFEKLFLYNIVRDDAYQLKMKSDMTEWNEKKLKEYYDNNGFVGLEGIYEAIGTAKQTRFVKYKIGLINNNDKIDVIYLAGGNKYDWIEGERKATLTKTATPNFYTTSWLMGNKSQNNDVYTYLDDESGLLTFDFKDGSDKKDSKNHYIKLYPFVEGNEPPSYRQPSLPKEKFRGSGSGFAVSKDGLVVTNHHVIDDAKVVKVQITQVGKNELYDAKIILSDPKNDLAILKIDDDSFMGFENIPFSIKTKVSDMGTSVYALGYPLINTMGESIKLTDGLISSKVGFQGDITSYQLSVPIQPGNSGGPLFDNQGNLVGVINAKHRGADNATYAIKSNILANLLELLPNPPSLDNSNRLSKLSLTKQAAIIEDFVVLIKVR